MAILRFVGLNLEDFEQLPVKDPNTRYIVFNEDGTVYGEFIGDELIGVKASDFESSIEELELEAERLDGEIARVEQKVDEHIEDVDNPHGVTAEQVGTYDKATIDQKDVDTLQAAKDYTYSKADIDAKDDSTLQAAKDFTYGRAEIDAKDASTLQEAKDYTDILGADVLELQDRVEVVEDRIEDIEDGTTVVKRAEQDEDGNSIKDTYATVAYVDSKVGGVVSVNGKTGVVELDAEDVGALPADTPIPTKVSDLDNDEGFVKESDLEITLLNYVEKEAGKGLSTNDYTDAEKAKLAGIEPGAQVNTVNPEDLVADNISFDGSGTNYLVGETDVEGAIKELDTRVKTNADNVDDLELEVVRLDDKIEAVEQEIDGHIVDMNNPHGVTAEQVGTYDKAAIDQKDANVLQEAKDFTYGKTEIDTKDTSTLQEAKDYTDDRISEEVTAEKVKQLYESNPDTNAFTDAEKAKLASVEAGAQVNRVNSVNGKTGAVVLNQDDVGDGASYKRVTQAEKDTWNNKQDKLIAGDNITIDENNVISASSSYIDISYADLVALRDSNSLEKGAFYRIIDYVTTTVQANTRSAGHQFDIIVQALDERTISENARACLHEGDTYFTNSKLEAWELKYCLDNDTARFAWADEVNGKGVIYYMKDEYNNEAPYDFKNIQFKRDLFYDSANDITFVDVYFYTFSAYSYALATGVQGDIEDATIITKQEAIDVYFNSCYNNVIKPAFYIYYTGTIDAPTWELNNNILVNTYASGESFFACHSNTFGVNCRLNTIGNNFYYNVIGDNFRNNTIGNNFYFNSIGNSFSYNTIGNNFYYNTIGNSFRNNTIGNNFSYNTIGNSFSYNIVGNYFSDNTVGNDVRYIQFSLDGTSGNRISYLYLKDGLAGASTINKLDLYFDGLYGRAYPTTFERMANGNIVASWEVTPLTRARKVKETNTTATWSDTLDGVIYWQGTTSAWLGDIITDMLGQAKNSTRPNDPVVGDPCDVYELRVDAYNDSDPYQGSALIYVPHNENKRIRFYLMLVYRGGNMVVDYSTDLTYYIEELDYYGYKVSLKLVAKNQPYLHSFS